MGADPGLVRHGSMSVAVGALAWHRGGVALGPAAQHWIRSAAPAGAARGGAFVVVVTAACLRCVDRHPQGDRGRPDDSGAGGLKAPTLVAKGE